MKKFILLAVVTAMTLASCANPKFDSADLENSLMYPYAIEGVLTQDGEAYDVIIENLDENEFNVHFLSGVVTEGLTVEFRDGETFLFFDDLRFKTQSETYQRLEIIKTLLDEFASSSMKKRIYQSGLGRNKELIKVYLHDRNADTYMYFDTKEANPTLLVSNALQVNTRLEILTLNSTAD